jgi:hypothetical protein
MRNNLFSLRGAVLAAALVAASATASADNFSASFNFDNVLSGSVADTALGSSFSSLIHFGNADTAYDADGVNTHWVDGTSTYGNVLVQNDGLGGSNNVLWNSSNPILVMFATEQTISAFSIQQDLSGNGSNLQTNGTYMVFLDNTGHEIAGSQVYYTQSGNPGLTIQSSGTFANVSGVLLSGGVSYDNLSITAVPEPDSWAMLAGGLLMLGAVVRRRA